MKVVHISYSDKIGGAAIAAYRHNEAMRRAGIDSHMLVQIKTINGADDIKECASKTNIIVRKIFTRIFSYVNKFYASWSWNHYGFDLSENIEVKEADVVILHWINCNTISIKSVKRILESGKQVYWFMHDMWPLTGGCHYSFECERYRSHCQQCPMAHNLSGSRRIKDLAFRQFEEKMKCLSKYDNLHFLAPSKWLAECVSVSALFRNNKINVVRNVLDTNIFKPLNKHEARKWLRLPADKKLILFGADNVNSPYKGWDLLKNAITEPIENVEAVVYGTCTNNISSQIGIRLHELGRITNIRDLVNLYSACDVLIVPSLADNYPNVIMEAHACGLPVIGSNIGGVP